MPPRPLSNITTGREVPTEYQALTPRTPHSRGAESFTDIELERLDTSDEEEDDDDETDGLRSPLLPPPSQSRRKVKHFGQKIVDGFNDWRKGLRLEVVLARIPILIGGFLAAFMVYLILISYDSPGLDDYIGRYYNKTWHPEMVISYENYTEFPLKSHEYLAECYKLHKGIMHHRGYWNMNHMSLKDVMHPDDIPGRKPDPHACRSSITYMLGGDVGLLADLALLAQAAALARERNRTFLVDDTYWDRGRWTDYFEDVRTLQLGPQPGCKPPLPQELVACPRLARHWVINSRTAKFHFGHPFFDHYEDPYAHNLNRLIPIFEHAATSVSTVIRPNAHISQLIHTTRSEMLNSFPQSDSQHPNMNYTSVHIRRGDRKAVAWEFHNGYVPVSNYVEAVSSTWKKLFPTPSPDMSIPRIYLASDSHEAIGEFKQKFGHTTAFTLLESKDPKLRALASPGEYFQKAFWNLTLETRIQATRGMIVEFALLSGAWASETDPKPEAVICTISSAACKLAAVSLGWNKSFGDVDSMGRPETAAMRWVEIDQKGAIVPIWEPFELFN